MQSSLILFGVVLLFRLLVLLSMTKSSFFFLNWKLWLSMLLSKEMLYIVITRNAKLNFLFFIAYFIEMLSAVRSFKKFLIMLEPFFTFHWLVHFSLFQPNVQQLVLFSNLMGIPWYTISSGTSYDVFTLPQHLFFLYWQTIIPLLVPQWQLQQFLHLGNYKLHKFTITNQAKIISKHCLAIFFLPWNSFRHANIEQIKIRRTLGSDLVNWVLGKHENLSV